MESEKPIPEGWGSVPLNQLVSPSKEKVEPADDPDAFYIGLEHIEPNTTRIIGHGFARDTKSTKTRFFSGSILYGKLRPYLNKVSIPDFDGVCSTDILVFPPIDAVDTCYLMRFLSTSAVVDFATHQSSGMELPRTNYQKLGQLQVPLPPIAEQRRIVARLEALLADVERVRGRLEAVAATMQRFRQAVLAAAFSGDLTAELRRTLGDDIETNPWVMSTISTVGLVSGGLTKNRKRSGYDTHLPYLRVANVYADRLDLSDVEEIGVDANELPRILLKKGDLLIVEGNGSLEQIGRVALWNGEIEPCVHQNHIIKIRFSDATDRRFALYWLLSPAGRQAITDVATSTSGLHTLSISKVENLPIPLPPLPEQHEIVRRVDALFALADRIEGEVAGACERVEALTQAVLAKAFRGELVPTEAELARREGREYEPAGVLLERVQAEQGRPRCR
ncbi:MAG: restriction endonuclease subunit S [Methanoregulaceae archaeon]